MKQQTKTRPKFIWQSEELRREDGAEEKRPRDQQRPETNRAAFREWRESDEEKKNRENKTKRPR